MGGPQRVFAQCRVATPARASRVVAWPPAARPSISINKYEAPATSTAVNTTMTPIQNILIDVR